MSYIILFLLMLVFISFLPQLIYFFLIMWVVLTVARVFMPKRRPGQRPQDQRQNQSQNQQQTNQNTQSRSSTQSDDVIDVEFTEREVDE